MSKKVTLNVFKFDELSDKAKKVVIEKEIQFLNETFDVKELTGVMKEKVGEAGFLDVDVYWRLSNCQGDGVAFKFRGVKDEKGFLEKDEVEKLPPDYEFFISATVNGRYTHFNSMDWDYDWRVNWKEDDVPDEWVDLSDMEVQEKFDEKYYSIFEKLVDSIESAAKNLCYDLEQFGYDWIKKNTSEELALESIKDRDGWYFEGGEAYDK